MIRPHLIDQIRRKRSVLCVGLDSDIARIPKHITLHYDNPVLEFNRRIIKATAPYAVAYKFNIAFYESLGVKGWEILRDSLALIPEGVLTIADAKRGDIGNTAKMYAKTFFETFNFDALTVSPYMGLDTLEPYYSYSDKWVIVLGLTSNTGNRDFQLLPLQEGGLFYETLIKKIAHRFSEEQTMFVVGATNASSIQRVRDLAPNHFFLMPGVGSQGGSLEQAIQYGKNQDFGMLINSSRGIIFADDSDDFDQVSGKVSASLQQQMAEILFAKC